MSSDPKNAAACCDAPPKKKGFLSNLFKKCAACAGSGAGGFLAGHAGCVITPAVLAVAGTTAATGGMSVVALAFSAAVTAGGLYAWHKLRGKTAGSLEKKIVIAGAVTGLAVSSFMHLRHCDEHPAGAMEPAKAGAPAVPGKTCPCCTGKAKAAAPVPK